jgi:hypothetical protein
MYIVTFECEERHFASIPKIIEAKLKFPKQEKYVIPIADYIRVMWFNANFDN